VGVFPAERVSQPVLWRIRIARDCLKDEVENMSQELLIWPWQVCSRSSSAFGLVLGGCDKTLKLIEQAGMKC